MSKSVLKILTFVVFLFPQILSAGTDSLFFDFCGNGEFHELILTDKKYDGADVSLWKFANQASDEQLVSTSKKRFPVVSYQSKVMTEFFGENKIQDGDKISVLWFKIDCEARCIFPVKNFEN